MAISEQGKKIWKTPAGGNLMRAMLCTQPMTEQDKQTLQELKQTSSSEEVSQYSNSTKEQKG